MSYDKLLYGKSGISRVVGLECNGTNLDVYRLLENGETELTKLPFKYWLLSSESGNSGWVKMKGNLHYQYGKQFSTKAEFAKARHMMKDTCYSVWNPTESAQLKDGISFFLGLKPIDLPILSFDLETTGLNPDLPDAKVLLISNTFRKNGAITRRLFAYDDYESQAEMLTAWSEWVCEMNPAVITGHNIFGFDFPYMISIAEQEGVTLNIGRDGSPATKDDYEANFRVDGSKSLAYNRIHVYGRQCIDTMFLAYRYDIASKKYDSYGLKQIIKQEGLEKAGRVFYDAGQIRFNYTKPEEWAKIKTYCNEDSDDSLALFDLMSPAQFYWTRHVPRSFQQVHESATGAQLNGIMVRSYLQDRHSIPRASPVAPFQGAISLGVPGVFDHCVRWDIASLYPSIILTYNIYDAEKDPNKHFLQMMKSFTEERLKNKQTAKETGDIYYKQLEQSQKVGINSGYGYLSANGLNFNSPHNAALVTKYGREILVKGLKWATGITDEEILRLLDH
jgi:DNA polymerase I